MRWFTDSCHHPCAIRKGDTPCPKPLRLTEASNAGPALLQLYFPSSSSAFRHHTKAPALFSCPSSCTRLEVRAGYSLASLEAGQGLGWASWALSVPQAPAQGAGQSLRACLLNYCY